MKTIKTLEEFGKWSEKHFKFSPKPRDLNDTELDKLKLRFHDGTPMRYSFETTGHIWVSQNTDKDPYYRFYVRGTNDLLTIVYYIDKDSWEKIEFEKIPYLYSMVWLMCLDLLSCDKKSKRM